MEIWKDIKDFEGLYQVSNYGNVRNTRSQLVLKQRINHKGYKIINLRNKNICKTATIHRLVALAFIDNPNDFPIINHKDEDKTNNNVDNLEWCTYKYNSIYSLAKASNVSVSEYLTNYHAHKYTGRKNNKQTIPVNQIDLNGNVIKTWDNARQIFNELHWSDWSISECCRGNRKIAYGYRWQYAI